MAKDSQRPLILVTNDDGITAPGIRNLVESVADLGEVVVVAPDSHQSGMGHAITISNILRMAPHDFGMAGVDAYKTSGTPVDCVKLAIYKILKRKPDLLLSGINHGSNASINVIYSGTMSAAVEGALEGIPPWDFLVRLCGRRRLQGFKRGGPYGGQTSPRPWHPQGHLPECQHPSRPS